MNELRLTCERVKTLWEKEKMLVTSIFFFPTKFSEVLSLFIVKSSDVSAKVSAEERREMVLNSIHSRF